MSRTVPTIYDVAASAGVSISTVSRVLNNPQLVNESTRNAVLAAIDHLGFVPKTDARVRAMKRSRQIGVITPFMTAQSFVQRQRGAASALREHQYEMVVYPVETSEMFESYMNALPLTHTLDGLIILSLQITQSFADRLVRYGLETVLVEYPIENLNSIEIDDVSGGRMAAQYLIKKGHRAIGFAGDLQVTQYGVQPIAKRLEGLRQGLAAEGLSVKSEYCLNVVYDMESTRKAAYEFLQRSNRPTAIFAATDLQAIAILRTARDLGMRVPEDLAIIGFDDLDAAEYMDLTTIRQHLDESGRVAVELLLNRLENPNRPVQHIQLSPVLIERKTS